MYVRYRVEIFYSPAEVLSLKTQARELKAVVSMLVEFCFSGRLIM